MPRVVTDEEIAANADQWGKLMHKAISADPSTVSDVGFFLVIFRTDGDGAVGMSWSGGKDSETGRQRVMRVIKRCVDRIKKKRVTPMGLLQ